MDERSFCICNVGSNKFSVSNFHNALLLFWVVKRSAYLGKYPCCLFSWTCFMALNWSSELSPYLSQLGSEGDESSENIMRLSLPKFLFWFEIGNDATPRKLSLIVDYYHSPRTFFNLKCAKIITCWLLTSVQNFMWINDEFGF